MVQLNASIAARAIPHKDCQENATELYEELYGARDL
jgi:hypothetical protein